MTYKIMVVEDDRPILELMDMLIRRLGYEPVLESDGLTALETISHDPPALILLDIMMTPIDGWLFLKKLRDEMGLLDLPVIIFSAAPEVEERMARIKDPMLSVLHKPVSLNEMRARFRHYLPEP